MSARRQPSVQVVSGLMTGLVVVLNATLLGSSCIGSARSAGGGTTLGARWGCWGGRADVEVGAQRTRNLRRQEFARALAGDSPDHFADQVAVVQRVVARGRP